LTVEADGIAGVDRTAVEGGNAEEILDGIGGDSELRAATWLCRSEWRLP